MKSLLILATACCMIPCMAAWGQPVTCAKQIISSGGGNARNGQVQIIYTLGQSTTIGTSIQGTMILQQGFQTGELQVRPNPSSQTTPLEVFVYPNPTTGKITIRHSEEISSSLHLVLYDLEGRSVEEQIHQGANEITTSFRTTARGVYQLFIECLESDRKTIKNLIFL